MKDIAIYVRVSTDKQDYDRQLEMCKEYCRRNNFNVFKIYADVFSGVSARRPSFNKLIADMRAFRFDTIIVTKIDRIGRSLQHLLTLIDEFNNKKVNFIAITQNIDTSSSMGKLQMHILGAFAEFERNLISERTKEGLIGKENVGKRGKDKKPRRSRSDRGLPRPKMKTGRGGN